MGQVTLGTVFEPTNAKRGANGCNKEMNRIYYEWLMDHINSNSRRGDIARAVRDKKIQHTDTNFPRWHDYESLT